jgi:hypothetical protein
LRFGLANFFFVASIGRRANRSPIRIKRKLMKDFFDDFQTKRISCREKAFSDVLDVINSYISDLKKLDSIAENDMSKEIMTAENIRNRVISVYLNGKPIKKSGNYYIGILSNGQRECFFSAKRPNKISFGNKYASVLGPIRTSAGAEYRIAHPDVNVNVIFE